MNRNEINRSEKFNRSNFGPVYEDFAFWFIIAGALCAECIPLAAALIGAAGVLLGIKKRCPSKRTAQGRKYMRFKSFLLYQTLKENTRHELAE